MEKAIKSAVEVGYKFLNSESIDVIGGGERSGIYLPPRITAQYKDGYCRNVNFREITGDILFWKSLAKAEKWDEDSGVVFNHRFLDEKEYAFLVPARFYPTQNSWQYHMHCFVDHIADEKDIDDFFNQLIKGK